MDNHKINPNKIKDLSCSIPVMVVAGIDLGIGVTPVGFFSHFIATKGEVGGRLQVLPVCGQSPPCTVSRIIPNYRVSRKKLYLVFWAKLRGLNEENITPFKFNFAYWEASL